MSTDYTYIDSSSGMLDYMNSLKERNITVTGVDLEGEFNLHHYGEHLCLVQIFDGEKTVLIDPKGVTPQLLKEFFENRQILKIMYDCTGDRTLLFRQLDINIEFVLDLYPAVELLEYPKKSLGALLEEEMNYVSSSKKKFQQYNWMQRPISPEALEYAAADVHYLIELKDLLLEKLLKAGVLDEYIRRNMDVQSRKITKQSTPGVYKKNQFKKMPKTHQAIFRQLFEARDKVAARIDLPPNSVVSNIDLFELSSGGMRLKNLRFNRKITKGTVAEIQFSFQKILGSGPA